MGDLLELIVGFMGTAAFFLLGYHFGRKDEREEQQKRGTTAHFK